MKMQVSSTAEPCFGAYCRACSIGRATNFWSQRFIGPPWNRSRAGAFCLSASAVAARTNCQVSSGGSRPTHS
jgi:hypothetical protein